MPDTVPVPAAPPAAARPSAPAPSAPPPSTVNRPAPREAYDLPPIPGVDPQVAEDFKDLARDLGLAPDAARRLIAFYAEANRRVHDGWRSRTAADRELGGANLARNVATAGRAIDRFGGPDLRRALDDTGAGNHPEVVRFFVRVGKALAEDGLVRPAHGRVAKSYGETFYPKHKSKE